MEVLKELVFEGKKYEIKMIVESLQKYLMVFLNDKLADGYIYTIYIAMKKKLEKMSLNLVDYTILSSEEAIRNKMWKKFLNANGVCKNEQ